jgi:hypothetical protein
VGVSWAWKNTSRKSIGVSIRAGQTQWTAAVLKESAEDDATWIDFALVARDLADEGALEAMPLAAQIAAATVEAFVHR